MRNIYQVKLDDMTREEQLIWAAGFLDSRGGFYCTYNDKKHNLKGWSLRIANTNEEVLDAFQELFGTGSVVGPQVNTNGSTFYTFLARTTEALPIIYQLLPYMQNDTKKERFLLRIKEAKEFYSTKTLSTTNQWKRDLVLKAFH